MCRLDTGRISRLKRDYPDETYRNEARARDLLPVQ